jgi:hypothetical protein
MAEERLPPSAGSPTAEAVKIAEAAGTPGQLGLSRAAAAEHLKARGILPPGTDGKPHYVAPAELPAHLVALLEAPKADPAATNKALAAAGHDYAPLVAKVSGLRGVPAGKAAELSAGSLLALAAFADHHAAMAARFKKP